MTKITLIDWIIAIPVGTGLMMGGVHLLNHVEASTTARVGVGAAFFISGVSALLIWPGPDVVFSNPLLLGVWAFLIGFGINQLVVPFRNAA